MREKRKFIRFDVALKVAYTVQKGPRVEKSGHTKDISAHGIQLLTNDKLALGDKVELRLYVPESPNPAHIKGIVMWSKDLVEGAEKYRYSSGIDFEKIEEDNKNTFLKFLCGLMYR